MSEVKTTRYGKGSDMDGVAARLHYLLFHHAEELKAEGLEQELKIITHYVEQCCAGKLKYTLLLESIGLDVLHKVSAQLKTTANAQQRIEEESTESSPDNTADATDYSEAREEIDKIIEDLIKANEMDQTD